VSLPVTESTRRSALTATATTTQTPRPDVESRNAVVLEHYPLVQRIANRVAHSYGLPVGLETADLVSYGVLGLVEAWERFDPARGVPFESYAIPRVRGAIVDAIRNGDWVPRKVRDRARRINERTTTLTAQLGRTPTTEEIEASLGPDAGKRNRMPATVLTLEAQVADGSLTVADALVDTGAEEPGWALEDAELRRQLVSSINCLPERERFILTLYYFQNVQLTEIARVLGVTESRVSQIHMRALEMLRGQLQDVDQSA
jgi:RNA polymerase sigma factor FliA